MEILQLEPVGYPGVWVQTPGITAIYRIIVGAQDVT